MYNKSAHFPWLERKTAFINDVRKRIKNRMVELLGYALRERLREDESFALWRGVREDGHLPVLVKVPVSLHPSPSVRDRLEHAGVRVTLDE